MLSRLAGWVKASRGRIAAVAAVIVAALGAGQLSGVMGITNVYVGSPTVPTPTATPDPSTANLWVDTNGGTCVDNASPVGYTDAQACSWDAANDTCEGGDTVLVQGGSYGNVTLSGSNGRSSACTFTVVETENVVMGEFYNGSYTGGDTGADWITIDGGYPCDQTVATCGIYAIEFDADFTNRVTAIGWEVDGGLDNNVQLFHIEDLTNFTVRDSHIHSACAGGGVGAMIYAGGDGITLDNNDIHDALLCVDDDTHTECIYNDNVDQLTLTRNKIYRCNAQGVFFTGDEVVEGPSIVANNVIGRPCSDTTPTCNTPSGNAFHFRTGSDPTPSPDNMVIRNNTFRGNLSISTENTPTSGGLVVKDNVFLGGSSCPSTNTTYARNAHLSGSCGGTGSFNDAGMLSDFTDASDLSADGGDWYPLVGAPFINAGSTSDVETLDLPGNTRYDGSAPDLGAYEFQE
jgi:hypothetical protein